MEQHAIQSPKFVVVVGASAGGLHSVIELCVQFTEEMNIAVFVVLHVPHISNNDILIHRIQQHTSFIIKTADDGEPVQRNHIYLAEPDKHLLLKEQVILLGQGPPENRWRPSIDILFRSAAVAYKSHTIGIILSGMMQDGVAGMIAIKESGGMCIVQRPEEAEYPDMPRAVMNNVEVDYSISLVAMGALIQEKSRYDYQDNKVIPLHIVKEAKIAERVALGIEQVASIGDRSAFSCPDCGGGLWEIKEEKLVRYRCHTGHAYNESELFIKQSEALENTLWIALRMLDERKELLKKMVREETSKGWVRSAEFKQQRLEELNIHIERLKTLLFQTKSPTP